MSIVIPDCSRNKTAEIKRPEGAPVEKWECTVCGWIYDPAEGDPDGGIAPGIPFEQLLDSWVCPVCGAGKDAFVKK